MKTIETKRLVIRNFKTSDYEALLEMILQYEASGYAVYDQPWPVSPEEIKGVVEWFTSGDSYLAVCLKDTYRFIGFVALNPEQKEDCQELNLGYIFNSNFHGKGYATEACQAVIEHAFNQLLATRVISGTASINRPSCQLLERLGFKTTGESRVSFRNTEEGKPVEFLGYSFALSRDEWEAARQE